MTEYYTEGKVTIAKGTKLYHWSNDGNITVHNNLFLCLSNSLWKITCGYLYTYKLKKNIELILTITHPNIEGQTLDHRDKKQDRQRLSQIFDNECNNGEQVHDDWSDVNIKTHPTNFPIFCKLLLDKNYHGLFNYIDMDAGRFEVCIFNVDEYLKFVSCENSATTVIKEHSTAYSNKIMCSNKLTFEYPFEYSFPKRRWCDTYPSIFYFIKNGANSARE